MPVLFPNPGCTRANGQLRKVGEDYEFVVESEALLIYLDHWAVRRLSENATLGNRFLVTFKHRSLAHVVDLTRGSDGDAIRRKSTRQEGQLVNNLQEWRDGHGIDPGALDKKYPVLPLDLQKPMRPIYHGLARLWSAG